MNAPRRRRLTIAALVLLVFGGGLWWSTRPKIDPRLVGTWCLISHDDSRFWSFRADGTGEDWYQNAGEPPSGHDEWEWYFDGQAIITRRPSHQWTDSIPLRLFHTVGRVMNLDSVDHGFSSYPVESIGPDELRAEVLWADEVFTLGRVPK